MIKTLTIDYKENPIGLAVAEPRFSWKYVADAQDVCQVAYQLVVTRDGEIVWNTGKVEDDTSILIPYEVQALVGGTAYKVHLTVWDNKEEEATKEGSFEMGLLSGQEFCAKWITHTLPAEETACPTSTKVFNVTKEVLKVRFYGTPRGVYEVIINGKKEGVVCLALGWRRFNDGFQYNNYV